MKEVQKMLCTIDKAIEEKYKEIRERGEILSGIEDLHRQIRYERPELAAYIERQMMDIATKEGDMA